MCQSNHQCIPFAIFQWHRPPFACLLSTSHFKHEDDGLELPLIQRKIIIGRHLDILEKEDELRGTNTGYPFEKRNQ